MLGYEGRVSISKCSTSTAIVLQFAPVISANKQINQMQLRGGRICCFFEGLLLMVKEGNGRGLLIYGTALFRTERGKVAIRTAIVSFVLRVSL